jgi:hypothetical protein
LQIRLGCFAASDYKALRARVMPGTAAHERENVLVSIVEGEVKWICVSNSYLNEGKPNKNFHLVREDMLVEPIFTGLHPETHAPALFFRLAKGTLIMEFNSLGEMCEGFEKLTEELNE